MIGVFINTGAVFLGGLAGMALRRGPSARIEQNLRRILGVLVIYLGFSTFAKALGHNGLSQVPKQIGISLLALILGNALGMLLGLQNKLNTLGQFARQSLVPAEESAPKRLSEGFVTCTLLFCLAPLAILGAVEEGLNATFKTFALKSVMDGMAAFAFARTLGAGVLLSAVPLLAYQGALTLAVTALRPLLESHAGCLPAANAALGLLLVCVSVVVFEIHKVPLANYLPTLLVAPLLAYWWGF